MKIVQRVREIWSRHKKCYEQNDGQTDKGRALRLGINNFLILIHVSDMKIFSILRSKLLFILTYVTINHVSKILNFRT